MKADEALRIGLADEVVPGDELHDRALALGGRSAPGARVLSQALAKQAIDDGLSTVARRRPPASSSELFVESFRTDDSQIGVKSFLEHGPGKAEFTGT